MKAFDDDHNGSLDQQEFERFAKSLMKSGCVRTGMWDMRAYPRGEPRVHAYFMTNFVTCLRHMTFTGLIPPAAHERQVIVGWITLSDAMCMHDHFL